MIVLAVFVGALFFFGSNITENIASTSAETTPMSDATLPVISLEVSGCEINRLHGYVSNLDAMVMRESVTPLKSSRNFTVLINENESDVKKLKYEVYNEDGIETESDTFTVLDVESGPKKVDISLQETMKSGREYVIRITLITNKSKRIYYYTRLKMYDDGYLFEKLEFAKYFHDTLINGSEEEKEELKKYLESSKASDNSSFASVNIKSSFDMVTWGDLNPQVVWEELPTINEFYDSMASLELKSVVSVETEYGTELYVVKEHMRFNYTAARVYLYTYDRTMEAVFNPKNVSLSKSEFKLGVTGDVDAQTAASDSGKYLAFVYGRELNIYGVGDNRITDVFSFRQDNGDYSRDYYDQHDIRLIRVHDNGDTDFLVYGYMNRGEYEGRVGIVLYRFVYGENRIEEQLYIPVNTTFQLLKSDMTDFAYLGERDVFYFSLYDSIYSFNLVTDELETLADHVPEDCMLYCEEKTYLIWQDSESKDGGKHIYMLDLETGEIRSRTAPEGETVRLYGRINDNFIYGYAYKNCVSIKPDGSRTLPAYKLVIENKDGEILKTYQESGLFIDHIEIGENILVLKRLKRKAGDAVQYEEAPDDSIMNRPVEAQKPVELTKRITDRILTEYYVSFPDSVHMDAQPATRTSLNTVINRETTFRVSEPEDRTIQSYAYSFGSVVYADPDTASVISAADRYTGTVISRNGRLVWERGVKSGRSEISGLATVSSDAEMTSLQAAMKMLLQYKNQEVDTTGFDVNTSSASGWLRENTALSVVDLSGATLDEALYYVYKSRPVIAIRDNGIAGVITAYDAVSVTVWEPSKRKSTKYQLKEATAMYEAAGNLFISYVD